MDEIICGCEHGVSEHGYYGCNHVDAEMITQHCRCGKSDISLYNSHIATLRSLLSDAMKELGPFADENLNKALEHFSGENVIYVSRGAEFKVKHFRAAAALYARIKATLTGGE